MLSIVLRKGKKEILIFVDDDFNKPPICLIGSYSMPTLSSSMGYDDGSEWKIWQRFQTADRHTAAAALLAARGTAEIMPPATARTSAKPIAQWSVTHWWHTPSADLFTHSHIGVSTISVPVLVAYRHIGRFDCRQPLHRRHVARSVSTWNAVILGAKLI